MTHPYDQIAAHLSSAFAAIADAGLTDVLPKGGVGAILLAHHLDHTLVPGDKGADASDSSGKKFEYKVSITNQFNFHFGARRECESPEQAVRRHFNGIEGAYCARRDGCRFVEIAYCPSKSLVEYLCDHFNRTKGRQLNMNISIKKFLKLPNSTLLPAQVG